MLTKNVQDGDPIVVPLLKDAERNAIVLPLDRAQGALESGDQIVVQGMGSKSEIVIVDTVQTDLTNNEVVVLLRTPLQEAYSTEQDARIIKHSTVGIGEIIGIRYEGDDGVHLERVGKSAFIEIGMPGDVAFQRVFDQLVDLQSAVSNRGKGAIEELSHALDSSIEHVTILQTQLGGKLNRADTLRNRLGDKKLALEQFLETVEQIDYSDAVVEYQIQLNLLTAMLQTGARTMSPSLFNFM
jgi:flagellin-like hook-associated protein FlgL